MCSLASQPYFSRVRRKTGEGEGKKIRLACEASTCAGWRDGERGIELGALRSLLLSAKQFCNREGSVSPTESRELRVLGMRLRRASETEEEREARLQQMRERRASETPDEREAGLQQMRLNQERRLANESQEEREACLQQMRLNQEGRVANESQEERESRLQQMSLYRQCRLATEPPEDALSKTERATEDKEKYNQQFHCLYNQLSALRSQTSIPELQLFRCQSVPPA